MPRYLTAAESEPTDHPENLRRIRNFGRKQAAQSLAQPLLYALAGGALVYFITKKLSPEAKAAPLITTDGTKSPVAPAVLPPGAIVVPPVTTDPTTAETTNSGVFEIPAGSRVALYYVYRAAPIDMVALVKPELGPLAPDLVRTRPWPTDAKNYSMLEIFFTPRAPMRLTRGSFFSASPTGKLLQLDSVNYFAMGALVPTGK